jgi:hypothetical protein
MEPARYETAKLRDVDDTYYFGVCCNDCQRQRRLSLVRLRAALGDDYLVVDIRKRMKCTTCHSKKIIISFFGPHQAVGSLAYLFDQVPG